MQLSSLLTFENFQRAFDKVYNNKGSAGIDKITVYTFKKNLKEKLQNLIQDVMVGTYQAQPCLQVDIPKGNDRFRKLAIPTVRDRVLQTVLSNALVPFFEPHFEKCSYGYRPNRSYLQAVQQVEKYRDQGYQLVLDADIKSYFDHIPHNKLLQMLQQYIPDEPLINLVKLSLTHMQYHQKRRVYGVADHKGLPQGSPLSPVLANMYLDPLDEALLEQGFVVVRYADDFVVLCESNTDASKAMATTQRILNELGLEFNYDKTRIVDFDAGFVFLGHYFIGGLTQPLMQETGQNIKAQWVWDAPSTQQLEPFNKTANNNSDESTNVEINFDPKKEFEQAIVDCLSAETELQMLEQTRSDIRLVSKLRSLYVTKQGAVIHKLGGRYEIRHAGKVLSSVPINQVDNIMVLGAVHFTRSVTLECISNNVPILLMTQTGHFQGIAGAGKVLHPDVIKAQSNISASLALNIAVSLINAKIQNSLTLLRRKCRQLDMDEQLKYTQGLKQLALYAKKSKQAKSIAELRGIEGTAAKIYFLQLKYLFNQDWQFTCRNRRPPKDPVNALISLGYHILFSNVQAFIQARGVLDNIGCLHHANYQPSLALDLMEPFRAIIVDHTVLQLTQSGAIKPSDFHYEQGACLITPTAKKRFITALESRLQTEVEYRALGIKTDFRRIIDLQILAFKQSIVHSEQSFTPFKIR